MKFIINSKAMFFGFIALLASMASVTHAADQNIAISFKQDIFTEQGFEAACISLQLGTMLAKNGATVTLFPSLDGVRVANATHLAWADTFGSGVEGSASGIGQWQCHTSMGSAPLSKVVNGFISAGGSMLVCPLCWNARYGGDENAVLIEGASIGNSTTLAELFIGADKILDF